MPTKSTLSNTKSTRVNKNNSYSLVGNTRHTLPFWFGIYTSALRQRRIVFKRQASPGRAQAD